MPRLLPTCAVLLALLTAGCSKSNSSGSSSNSSGSSSGKQGKTFTPDKSGNKGGPGNSSGDSANAPLPSPADTTNGKASASSDAGDPGAVKGQAVMNPGAPTAHPRKESQLLR